MKLKCIRLISSLIIIFNLFGIFVFDGHAKAATVYNLTPKSVCTLNDAITAANTDVPSGACPAGNGDDIINLSKGTFKLTANVTYATTNITVRGAGTMQTVIDGQTLYEGLLVDGQSSAATLNLQNFTIRRVKGFAICSKRGAHLNIDHVISRANNSQSVGAGLFSFAGAIVNVSNSAFVGNHSYNAGGGVFLTDVTADLKNVTISGNSSDTTAGGLGINSDQGTADVNLSNVTIVGNHAKTTSLSNGYAGGMIVYGNAATIHTQNVLLAFNLQNNKKVNCGTIAGGTFASNNGNLSNDSSCTYLTQSRDKQSIDPLLVSRAAGNHGGNTVTIAFKSGSPAIDGGVVNGLTADQRGTARPQGAGYDIGAYEYTPL